MVGRVTTIPVIFEPVGVTLIIVWWLLLILIGDSVGSVTVLGDVASSSLRLLAPNSSPSINFLLAVNGFTPEVKEHTLRY